MRPFFRCFARLQVRLPGKMPGDLRCAVQCLCAAALALTVTLSPLNPTGTAAVEPEAIPAALDFTLCAFSDDLELELLARVLAAEVGDRSYAAQAAVGAALLNRLADPRFPGELGAVIGDAGLRAVSGEIPTRSLRAARAALMGVDPTQGAVWWGERGIENVTAEFDGVAFGK